MWLLFWPSSIHRCILVIQAALAAQRERRRQSQCSQAVSDAEAMFDEVCFAVQTSHFMVPRFCPRSAICGPTAPICNAAQPQPEGQEGFCHSAASDDELLSSQSAAETFSARLNPRFSLAYCNRTQEPRGCRMWVWGAPAWAAAARRAQASALSQASSPGHSARWAASCCNA